MIETTSYNNQDLKLGYVHVPKEGSDFPQSFAIILGSTHPSFGDLAANIGLIKEALSLLPERTAYIIQINISNPKSFLNLFTRRQPPPIQEIGTERDKTTFLNLSIPPHHNREKQTVCQHLNTQLTEILLHQLQINGLLSKAKPNLNEEIPFFTT